MCLFVNLLLHMLLLPIYVLSATLNVIIISYVFVRFLVKKHRLKAVGKNEPVSLTTEEIGWLKYAADSPSTVILGLANRLRALCDNRPFVLYLRPFKMDNRIALMPPGIPPFEIESLIHDGMKSIGPMFALGNEQPSLSDHATRIHASDESWKSEVGRLMDMSGYIVLIPEDTEGTLWELDQLFSNPAYLSKAIFLNICTAGRDHPYWNRERQVYSEDDGKTFLQTLHRVAEGQCDALPSLDHILCAFLANNMLHVVCGSKLGDPSLWAFSAKMAAFLRKQPVVAPALRQ